MPSYKELRALFENTAEEEIMRAIERYLSLLYWQRDLQKMQRFYNDLCAVLKYLTVKRSKNEKRNLSQGADILEMNPLDSLCGFEQCRQYISYCCGQYFKNRAEELPRPLSPIIHSCLQFIHSNYFRNISLADAAEYTGTSKSYLSTLFKQEKGIRFSAYLNSHRMEKARNLLSSTNHLIYEVAEMVGFDNPYYFSKLFKETFHVSCKDYRREHFAIDAPGSFAAAGKESN